MSLASLRRARAISHSAREPVMDAPQCSFSNAWKDWRRELCPVFLFEMWQIPPGDEWLKQDSRLRLIEKSVSCK
jgi:hypothetical protein